MALEPKNHRNHLLQDVHPVYFLTPTIRSFISPPNDNSRLVNLDWLTSLDNEFTPVNKSYSPNHEVTNRLIQVVL